MKGKPETRKTILYIGHYFQNKTKSSDFVKELLEERYDIEYCTYNPSTKELNCPDFGNRDFNILVLFQVVPDITELKKKYHFSRMVFFPMFDASGDKKDAFWEQLRECTIINFSQNLHERLLKRAYNSHYIQYFPQPSYTDNYGQKENVYFWQRTEAINTQTVSTLLEKYELNRIHVHKVLDPEENFIYPPESIEHIVTYSEWYNTKKEMYTDIEGCAFYIAPRLYEGIGLSFLEAMAMGRCVIAPDNPTMNEYITHGVNGLLYDYQQPTPLDIFDIRQIQRNVVDYMNDGYQKWNQEKYRIHEWIESAPTQKYGSSTAGMDYISIRSYKLLNLIPVMYVKDKQFKRYYDLFNIIRIFKTRRKKAYTDYYLFGVIRIARKP